MSPMPPTQTVTAITLPRWLEVTDRRGSNTGRYVRHYVISPNLSAADAALVSQTLTTHERLRRQAQFYRDYTGYVIVLGVLAIVMISLLQWSVLLSVAVALAVLVFERFGSEVSAKANLPLDMDGLQERSEATLFHLIEPNQYYRATSYARRSAYHAESVHHAMWRSYELALLMAGAEQEYAQVAETLGESSDEVKALAEKIESLRAAAQEADDKLLGMLDPNHQSVLSANEALSDLSEAIEHALEELAEPDAPEQDPGDGAGDDHTFEEVRPN